VIARDVRVRLDRFAALLLRWNRTLNLVAAPDETVLWRRHIEDSLQLAPLMPAGVEQATDLGSGGGFPGLVLAIATGVRFALIEADHRKAAFLRSAVLETGAPAVVHDCRIEQVRDAPSRLITARALAPLPRLLALAAPLLAPDGVCLLLKGATVEEEVAAARRAWRMTLERRPSATGNGTVMRISGLHPAETV
jgi:16S rRNA (guanine527-N7)-methyltransferase